jgi:hypothetical protein
MVVIHDPQVPESFGGSAMDINDFSEVVGDFWARGAEQAFIWRDGTLHYLPRHHLCGEYWNYADAINNLGTVVGQAVDATCTTSVAAIWWPIGSGMTYHVACLNSFDVRGLATDRSFWRCVDINDGNQILVFAKNDSGWEKSVCGTTPSFSRMRSTVISYWTDRSTRRLRACPTETS